jgi:hypothetical protein
MGEIEQHGVILNREACPTCATIMDFGFPSTGMNVAHQTKHNPIIFTPL